MIDHLKPSNYGAESAADVGVFALGAAIGGMSDAILNMAGFAEPMVVAGLAGAGALGLKKLCWDTPREYLRGKNRPSEREIALREVELEIALLRGKANKAEVDRWIEFLDRAADSGLDAESIRRLWLTTRL
ncbi:MAG: hypothetical protein K2W91_02380 [Novosphingobium sp.]|nr:hypothetical protein [Novosphingobium sp.]